MSIDTAARKIQTKKSIVEKLRRFLFGDDIFISYSRAESTYALTLANELTKKKLSCFLDQWGTPPGLKLPDTLINTIKRCSILVLVGSKNAADSSNVGLELEEFLRTGRPVIPITFVSDDLIENTPEDFNPQDLAGTLEKAEWYESIKGVAKTTEVLSALKTRKPSENVILRIVNAAEFRSRSRRLRKTFFSVLGATVILLLFGAYAVYSAYTQFWEADSDRIIAQKSADNAVQRQQNAEGKLSTAQQELSNANRSLIDTKSQLANANTELQTAQTQTKLAEDERAKAEDQRAKAESETAAAKEDLATAKVETAKQTTRNKHFRYAADLKTIQQSVEGRNYSQSQNLLESYLPENNRGADGFTDLRGFEWHYLWKQYHEDLATFKYVSSVTSVALMPEKNLAASVADELNISLMDVSAQRIIRQIRLGDLHFNPRYVAFSPNEKLLAAANDRSIRFWNVAEGKPAATSINGMSQNCQALAFSPADDNILLIQKGGAIIAWDIAQGKERKKIESDWLRTLFKFSLSKDQKILAASFGNGTIELHDLTDLDNKTPLSVFSPSPSFGRRMAFVPQRKMLAVTSGGTMSGSIDLIDVSDPAAPQKTDSIPLINKQMIYSLAASPDGRDLAIGYQDKVIELWSISDKKLLKTFSGHSDVVQNLEFSGDGNTLISSAGASVKLWNLKSPSPEVHLTDISQIDYPQISTLSYLENDNLLVGGKAGSIVRSIAAASRKENFIFYDDAVRDGYVTGTMFSPRDKNLIAIGTSGGLIRLRQLDQSQDTFLTPPPEKEVINLGFAEDGKKLAALYVNNRSDRKKQGGDPVLSLYDLNTKQTRFLPLFLTRTGNETDPPELFQPGSAREYERIEKAAFSADGKSLVTASLMGCFYCTWDSLEFSKARIRVWDISSGSVTLRNLAETRWVMPGSVAFSPDKKFVAVGFDNGITRVFNTGTLSEAGNLTGHADMVVAVDFTPDGKSLATSSRDRTIKLWSLSSMQELLTLHSDNVFDLLAFSPDSRLLVSGDGEKGILKFW